MDEVKNGSDSIVSHDDDVFESLEEKKKKRIEAAQEKMASNISILEQALLDLNSVIEKSRKVNIKDTNVK